MGELPLGEVEDQVHNSGMADNRISEGLKSEITWNQRTFWLVMVKSILLTGSFMGELPVGRCKAKLTTAVVQTTGSRTEGA